MPNLRRKAYTIHDLMEDVRRYKRRMESTPEAARLRSERMESAAKGRHQFAADTLGVPLSEIPLSLAMDHGFRVHLETLTGMPAGERKMLRDALAAQAKRQAAYEAKEAAVPYTVYRGLSRDGRTLGWHVSRNDDESPTIWNLGAGAMLASDWAGIEKSEPVSGFLSEAEAREALGFNNRQAVASRLFDIERQDYVITDVDVLRLDPRKRHEGYLVVGAFLGRQRIPFYSWVIRADEGYDAQTMFGQFGHVNCQRVSRFAVAGAYETYEAAQQTIHEKPRWCRTYRELCETQGEASEV